MARFRLVSRLIPELGADEIIYDGYVFSAGKVCDVSDETIVKNLDHNMFFERVEGDTAKPVASEKPVEPSLEALVDELIENPSSKKPTSRRYKRGV